MLKLEPEFPGLPQRCDSCRSAPCAFYCLADSAALCATCDADVHSVNPLARRHRRVPMGVVAAPGAGGAFVVRPAGGVNSSWPIREGRRCYYDGEEDEEATSWLLFDPLKDSSDQGLPPFGDALVADFLNLGGGAGEKEDASSSKDCSSSHGKSSEGSHEFAVPGEPVPERQGFGAVSMDITDYDASNFRRGYSFGASLGHSQAYLYGEEMRRWSYRFSRKKRIQETTILIISIIGGSCFSHDVHHTLLRLHSTFTILTGLFVHPPQQSIPLIFQF
ncbi:zinc finger protein CO3 isoform X2 [Oryza glaberrima]|uniref:zinc finger protein CO3 isoform X2 n=1 Tax=Oryza glaberrima TaxID=4538 RepID=UPI00224BFCE2|nr:zinc finger protein CO3 isoform X2 [Oryza glaberrima]